MIVDQSDYEPGGQWKEMWRDLDREARQYARIQQLHVELQAVKMKAITCDLHPSDGAFMALEHAIRKVKKMLNAVQYNLGVLGKQTADFEAVVTQARLLHVDEPQRDDIPAEDVLLERMSDLYGLPKPRQFRSGRREEDDNGQ